MACVSFDDCLLNRRAGHGGLVLSWLFAQPEEGVDRLPVKKPRPRISGAASNSTPPRKPSSRRSKLSRCTVICVGSVTGSPSTVGSSHAVSLRCSMSSVSAPFIVRSSSSCRVVQPTSVTSTQADSSPSTEHEILTCRCPWSCRPRREKLPSIFQCRWRAR